MILHILLQSRAVKFPCLLEAIYSKLFIVPKALPWTKINKDYGLVHFRHLRESVSHIQSSGILPTAQSLPSPHFPCRKIQFCIFGI